MPPILQASQANVAWTFQVSERIQTELDEFQEVVKRFQTGAINEGQFRIIRVPAGVYEQRENGTYMLRVRFPAGGATPAHLRRLGEVSAQFGNGLLHLTTRQEFQIHRVPLNWPRCAPASPRRWNCDRCRSAPPQGRMAKAKMTPPSSKRGWRTTWRRNPSRGFFSSTFR